MTGRTLALLASTLLLAACGTVPDKTPPPAPVAVAAPAPPGTPRRSPYPPAQEDLSKRGDYIRGGLYAPHIKDTAPAEIPDVDLIPEPQVVSEPRSRYGNRSPYEVLGQSYAVRDTSEGFVERGIASFYGNKFHGRRTSNLEVYDMYAFTAAHKTLPLPSFARITNLANGQSVVVRVNDRGPFHPGRVVDLSYAAAVKLGVHRAGTAQVEVRGLGPGDAGAILQAAVPPLPPTGLPTGLRAAPRATAAMAAPAAGVSDRPAAVPGLAAVAASAIDGLVQALPMASAQAGERPPPPAPVAAPAERDWRFDMRQDGKAMSADEFDAWMKARRASVATGRPAAMPAPSVAVPGPSAAEAPRPVAAAVADGVTLQVAAFGARANAERALSTLRGAGIGGARLLDGQANGQQIWRLRVGPVGPAIAETLSVQVAGLGFGRPQVVRE